MEKLRRLISQAAGTVGGRKGQTAIEYALVATLIAIVLVFAFKNAHVESGISAAASRVQSTLQSPP